MLLGKDVDDYEDSRCSNDDVDDDDELRPPFLTATIDTGLVLLCMLFASNVPLCKFSAVNFGMVDRRRRKKNLCEGFLKTPP